MPTPKKYRFEYWMFKTSKGIEKKMVCVLAGDKERKRNGTIQWMENCLKTNL